MYAGAVRRNHREPGEFEHRWLALVLAIRPPSTIDMDKKPESDKLRDGGTYALALNAVGFKVVVSDFETPILTAGVPLILDDDARQNAVGRGTAYDLIRRAFQHIVQQLHEGIAFRRAEDIANAP